MDGLANALILDNAVEGMSSQVAILNQQTAHSAAHLILYTSPVASSFAV